MLVNVPQVLGTFGDWEVHAALLGRMDGSWSVLRGRPSTLWLWINWVPTVPAKRRKEWIGKRRGRRSSWCLMAAYPNVADERDRYVVLEPIADFCGTILGPNQWKDLTGSMEAVGGGWWNESRTACTEYWVTRVTWEEDYKASADLFISLFIIRSILFDFYCYFFAQTLFFSPVIRSTQSYSPTSSPWPTLSLSFFIWVFMFSSRRRLQLRTSIIEHTITIYGSVHCQ